MTQKCTTDGRRVLIIIGKSRGLLLADRDGNAGQCVNGSSSPRVASIQKVARASFSRSSRSFLLLRRGRNCAWILSIHSPRGSLTRLYRRWIRRSRVVQLSKSISTRTRSPSNSNIKNIQTKHRSESNISSIDNHRSQFVCKVRS